MFRNDADVINLGEAFVACTLPKSAWTHQAHFAAALYLIRCRPDLPARPHMPGLIRRYNESVGGVNSSTAGYHETITLASIGAASAHAASAPAATLVELLGSLMAGPYGNKHWPLAHWSPALLFSVRARAQWVSPDLAALPFAV